MLKFECDTDFDSNEKLSIEIKENNGDKVDITLSYKDPSDSFKETFSGIRLQKLRARILEKIDEGSLKSLMEEGNRGLYLWYEDDFGTPVIYFQVVFPYDGKFFDFNLTSEDCIKLRDFL